MSKNVSSPAKVRVGMVSLGCAKNLVDSEVMLGHLKQAGAVFVQEPEEADVLIVNTCSFIHAAREESVQTIIELAALKETGSLKRLVVAGCMVQRYPQELKDSMPEVDAFVGLDALESIVEQVGLETSTPGASRTPDGPSTYLYDDKAPRELSTPPWTAYIKIAEGCDHTCSFCAIPHFRGTFRSRRLGSILREAETLAAQGVREVNLIAQDSSHFGRDLGLRDGLAQLLEGLDEIDALRWIRLHYLYPNTVTQTLIDTMARLPKVVKYVDIPLQHGHPATLKRMRRGGSAEQHLALLDRFRQAMPEVALRSTFIVGFPGETEIEFRALLDFVRSARFDHLGAFTYSHEENTGAITLADDVPEELKQERYQRLMEVQHELLEQRLPRLIGKTVEVLVEGPHPETEHLLVGRMAGQAMDVDGQILINDGDPVSAGQFTRVELTEIAGYDLVGRVVGSA